MALLPNGDPGCTSTIPASDVSTRKVGTMRSQMSCGQTVVSPAGFHLLARIALATSFVLGSLSLPFVYEPTVPAMPLQTMFPATTAHFFPALVDDAIVLRGSSDANDPNGLYGGCLQPPPASGVRRKSEHVLAAGKTVVDVSSIAVIDCHGFDGPGGTFVVPCPPDSRYSYCLRNENDGVGNHIYLGVGIDTVVPRCRLTERRNRPVAQIDIALHDPGTGIAVIELRDSTNTQTRHYYTDHRAPVVLTATKIDQTQPARVGIMVTDGAQNMRVCSFRF